MLSLKDIKNSDNLTKFFDENPEMLLGIGQKVVKGYQIDCESRCDWEKTIDEAMEIAQQAMKEKNFPWPKASNIKYPMIATAAIDFASRVYPEVLPNNRLVKVAIQGRDPTGEKFERGFRVADCMTYQLLSSPDWTQSVDSLLHILPVVGTVFKKTYYSRSEKRNISEVCSPKDIVVNYATKSLATATRITHKIKLSTNDIRERQLRGLYNDDIDITQLKPESCADDSDYEIDLLEQHCWFDLDDDGYKEPYIVIVHEETFKVLHISSRIDEVETIKDKETEESKVVRITADQYFTDFHFIRSFDGGFYSIGFGQLLLPSNKAINTLFNQLIDCGTLAITQGGFIGKGLRIKDGDYRFKPYEWKVVESLGLDIKDNIFQLPVREPSQVLFNLLGLLIDLAKDLTKSTEAMNGDISGSNVSRGTMNQMIEQGSKTFNAIYRRFLDSMAQEYNKLYKLNYYYLSNKEYRQILDIEDADVEKDFEFTWCDVRPVADPIYSSIEQRLSKVSVLMSLRTADPRAVDFYTLQCLQLEPEYVKMILPPPDPNQPPPAKDQKDLAQAALAQAQAKVAQLETLVLSQKAPLEVQKLGEDIKFVQAQTVESAARSNKTVEDAKHNNEKTFITATKMQQQETLKQVQAKHQREMDIVDKTLQDKELNLKAVETAAKIAAENKRTDDDRNDR